MATPPLLPLAGLLSALLTSCVSIPSGSATDEQIAALDTFEYAARDQTIGALRAGDPAGPRVVFVHGSPGEAEAWADFLVEPLPGAESVSIDRPGYGRSDDGPVLSLEAQAASLAPLLEERDGRWPILVGHSLGGPIVARAAADHPDRVGALVIVAGSVDPGLERLRWYNYAAKGISLLLPRDLRRSNQEMWDLKAELEQLEARLARITCPVWIVHGEQDGLVPFANVAFLERSLTSAREVRTLTWPEAGHFVIWEQPYQDQLREVLAGLLE